jgi:chemotaxis protein histidine kinase CheA
VKEAETAGAGADVTSTKTAAETAKTNAQRAQTDANSAQTTDAANAAKTSADNAKAAANNARTAALAAKTAAEARSLTDTKTSAIALANEAVTIADSAVTVADEAIALGGPSVAAANAAKTDAGLAKTAATAAKTSAEGATTAPVASAAKTAATDAKTKATAAKKAADDAKAGNVTAAEAKCKSPVLMTFTAKVEPNAAIPASGPVSPNVYWTIDSTGPNKEFIFIPSVDKTGNSVSDALTYCGKIGKFLILYNNATKDRNIQYKILAVEKTISNTYFKFNVEKVAGTTGFTKSNIRDGQDIFIRTSETQVISEAPSVALSTFKNACTDPRTSANCRPVCIPTDTAGNILYKEGTSMPTKIVESKNQWLANYYEYRPVRGIGGDGSVQYLPMDPSKTFVGGGTDCTEPCPPQDAGGVRPAFCRPPDPNWGQKPTEGQLGKCPLGCMKVDDPTSRRNTSACKFDKMTGHTCSAVCDFSAGSECKVNTDCANCGGDEYITRFPIGWKPTITRRIDEVYSRDDCNSKCKKASINTCLNFLRLDQSGKYLESRCRRIGTSGRKVICGPISNKTQTGTVSGYDICITCKSNKDLYAYFEYEKQWNPTIKQWDFVNIREISNPPSSWFEGDINSFSKGGVGGRSGDAGSGGSEGGGANLRGSKPSGYQEDRDTRGARDSRDMGKLQSSNNSKLISINSASQNAKIQENSAKVAAMKLHLDKLTNEYNSLEDNVKWNKMQMDKAEKDCYDMNAKLRIAVRDYTRAETISIMSGATIKEKKETEAANTLMYTIKQKTREICDSYGSLKDKYMKSVNEMNSLKTKISDLRSQYDKANASSGGGGSGGGGSGSFLSPIINIFFGDDANRDCSGQLGCGNGIDYSFPSPFNSAVGGKFTPQPFYGGIRL